MRVRHHILAMTGRNLIPIDPKQYARDKARVERGFWDKVRWTVGRVPFVEEAVAAYFCALDPTTPFRVKAVLLAALAYFVLPADMIPDFIAGFGFSDDAAVLATAIGMVAPAITQRHRDKARSALHKDPHDREAA